MKQLVSTSFAIAVILLISQSAAFAADANVDGGIISQSASILKKAGIDFFLFVITSIIAITIMRTWMGGLTLCAIFVFKAHPHIGTGWSIFVFMILYGLFLALTDPLFGTRKGETRNKKEQKSGPIGGFHFTEAMILDDDYSDPLARKRARRYRDWMLGRF